MIFYGSLIGFIALCINLYLPHQLIHQHIILMIRNYINMLENYSALFPITLEISHYVKNI